MDNMVEREIDLKDLMFFILNKWRLILVCTLALSVLIGGYKITTSFSQQNNKEYIADLQKKYDDDLKQYKLTKDGYESYIKKLNENIAYEETYQKKSVAFKLDPNNKWAATVDVFVKMDEDTNNNSITVDPADSVTKAYASVFSNGSLLEQLSQKMGIETQYLNELIDITTDYDGNMISVTASYESQEGAQEILNTILDSLDGMHNDISNSLGAHEIIVMKQNVILTSDKLLADNQKDKVNNLIDMRNKLDETENALTAMVKPTEPSNLSIKGIIKSGIKYACLGGVIGLFVPTFMYCIIFMFNQRLYSAEELKNRYRVRILGAYTRERKKRVFSGVDRFLDKLESKEYCSEEMIMKKIMANTSNYTENGQTILLTGTVNEEELKGFKDKLVKMLPEVHFDMSMDMNNHPETLTKLLKVDGIILIEKCGESKYNDIQKQLESIYNLNQKVIGFIVL